MSSEQGAGSSEFFGQLRSLVPGFRRGDGHERSLGAVGTVPMVEKYTSFLLPAPIFRFLLTAHCSLSVL